MSIKTKKHVPDLSKLEPLDGSNYRRWSQKLLIFFEQLEVDYILTTNYVEKSEAPVVDLEKSKEVQPDPHSSKEVQTVPQKPKASHDIDPEKFEKDNKAVRGYLLNHMNDSLFDLFVVQKSAKVIWDTLESRYGGDDAGRKKYVVGKWMRFQITDDKPVMDQVHEYENLVANILTEGMKMCEILQANVLLEKFPSSWSDYRNHLKHKKKDLTLQELISHMRTEEANRQKDKLESKSLNSVNANLVESSAASKDRFKSKNKDKSSQKKNHPFKSPSGKIEKEKSKLICYVCGKPGHKSYQCNQRKGKPDRRPDGAQANVVEADDIIAAVVVEANLVENKSDWILDTGASRHFCSNRSLFHEFHDTVDGECVYMGNSTTAGVLGKGKVLLKLTSGKTLSLNDVLYVPSLRRNLVSGSLLNRAGLKIVFEADKVVITKNGNFVGKGYLADGLFVLNTISTLVEMNESTSRSAYIVESIDVWHGRLGHVNIASIKRLKKLHLLNVSESPNDSRCSVCVEAKFAKKPFKPVTTRCTELLELIHSDLADFKNTTSKGGKKYYISFVDDFSRYTKIYLLKSKDEASSMFRKYKAEVENQLDKKIKRLRSDRGGEYSDKSLKEFCELNGIIHESTAPYSPQQNDIAERKNRSLKEMMNAMLISSGLPNSMWGEAVLSACFILNRVPHKKLDKTPYELWKGYSPNLSYLKNKARLPPSGALGKQAVAFRISGDAAAFISCRFIGAQDTLYDHMGRHYFKNCYIEGSVDFVFGDGLSLYDGCHLHAITDSDSYGALTAQKRNSLLEETGFSFLNCKVSGSGALYLGRAWGSFSRVIFAYTFMDKIITPTGWYNWGDKNRELTVFYGQYRCSGPGADYGGRVSWSRELTESQANPFLSLDFINANEWLPKHTRLVFKPR